jgi:hypothetical protein
MTRHTSARHALPRKLPPRAQDDAAIESPPAAIVKHPDGYYWIADGGLGEFGPFESYELAEADRDAVGEEAIAPGDALQRAERETGVADWIDAETEAPAEGTRAPHLREE